MPREICRTAAFSRSQAKTLPLKPACNCSWPILDSAGARRTVEDQLRELGERMGFDFMLVSAPDGSPLAGVVRQQAPVTPTASSSRSSFLYHRNAGFRVLDGRTFQVASVPVDQNDENIGFLSVGEYFDFSDLNTPVVLVHDGKVIESNLPKSRSMSWSEHWRAAGPGGVRPQAARHQLDLSARCSPTAAATCC